MGAPQPEPGQKRSEGALPHGTPDTNDKKLAMKRKLRLGLIGTGIAARELYLPAFKRLNRRIEVVACANRTRAKAEAYAKLAGVTKVVDSGEELIGLPEVDAVVVSLPIDKQPAFVLAALGAKKPVLSEK